MSNQRRHKQKFILTFDSEERQDFLTGFQKRKAKRRLKAKEILEQEFKDEKLRIKKRQKERLRELYDNQRSVPEIEHLLQMSTVSYDMPQQVVNITSIDANDISGKLGLTMGLNETVNDVCDTSGANEPIVESDGQCSDNDKTLQQNIIDVRKSIKKERLKTIASSRAFQTKQKLKHKKDLVKSKQRHKLLKREMRLNAKTKSINSNKNSKKRKLKAKASRKKKKNCFKKVSSK